MEWTRLVHLPGSKGMPSEKIYNYNYVEILSLYRYVQVRIIQVIPDNSGAVVSGRYRPS